MFLTDKKKIKKLRDIIINLKDLLMNKKHLLTLNFSFKSLLKLNYIISLDEKEISTFIKDAKSKKVVNNNKNHIFDFFDEKNTNDTIFGEIDSDEGEEDNKSLKSSSSESEEVENSEEDLLFLKPVIPAPLIKRSKSHYYKKKININDNNINDNDMNNTLFNKKYEISDSKIIELTEHKKRNNLPRLSLALKPSKTQYIFNNMNNTNINKVKPKEIKLKAIDIDLTKEQNQNMQNMHSFCKGFFIVSFPKNNAKIIENSKEYRAFCGHLICSKLPAMESEIIYKYPLKDKQDLELNNFCASICFPTGIKVCYNQDRRSTYKSFCTNLVNHKGDKYYMTVFYFYHKMDTLEYNKTYTDNSLKNYLRKFGENIFHTQQEKLNLEKDLEECQDLGFREFVYIPYAIALISEYPYINQMKEVLNNIFCIYTNHHPNNKTNSSYNNSLIDKCIINDLITYLIDSIPIPHPNSCISFNLPFSNNKIEIECPYKNNCRNISNLNFGNLLNYFSVDHILIIYRLILFEQKVLFIDKDYNRLCSIIQCFIDLLYPMEWVNTLIPVMSEQMTRYLQTFLPFVNGISEDLFNNNALNALKESEECVFQIFITKDSIKLSKYNNEIGHDIPKLPFEVKNKLINELKSIKEIYNNLDKNSQEIYADNINNIIKNIFLECNSIMLYDFMDFIFNAEDNYTILNFDMIINKKNKDIGFYQELCDTQNFNNFIQKIVNNRNEFALFINTLKNVHEKYIIDNDKKKGIKWKKNIERKVQLRDIQTKSVLFNLPNHLIKSSLDNTIKNIFIINKDSWSKVNNNNIYNDFIAESNRTSNYVSIIDEKLYKPKEKTERYILPEIINVNNKDSINEFEKSIKVKYVKMGHGLRKEFDLNEEEKEKMKEDFKNILLSLFKNEKNISIDDCLTYVYYSTGRDILCKLIYVEGFKVVKKIKEECFILLNKICLNALIAICNINENEETLECAVKITQAGFCYCKEKNDDILLIDELRSKLGKDYFMWIKSSFWNTWQNIENYFSINDYKSYCDVIKYEFIFKLLRLKIDKEFIFKYLNNSLEEKMHLLLEVENSSDDELYKQYLDIYNNAKNDIIETINTIND